MGSKQEVHSKLLVRLIRDVGKRVNHEIRAELLDNRERNIAM